RAPLVGLISKWPIHVTYAAFRLPMRRLTTLGVDSRACLQPTPAVLAARRRRELQDRLDDSTGCAARSAHLIGCERRGWLQPAAANVTTSPFVLERNRQSVTLLRIATGTT